MTPAQETFKERVESRLIANGAQALEFSNEKNIPCWRFKLDIDGQSWHLSLMSPGWSLVPLPYMHWDCVEKVWGWPHIGDDGSICAFNRDALDYDPTDIEGIVNGLIERTVTLLKRYQQLTPKNRLIEFADELEAYARKIGIRRLTLGQDIGNSTSVMAAVKLGKKPVIMSVHPAPRDHFDFSLQSINVVNISIENLPALTEAPEDKWWEKLLQCADMQQRAILHDVKAKGVILRVHNRFEGACLMLYWGRHPRNKHREIYRLEPAFHEYITRRVGQASIPKHVAVVGVGAIGSRVAEHLALAGIKELSLVDPDNMSADNLGRHVLDRTWIGERKAKALSSHLKNRMPGIVITPDFHRLDEWMNTKRAGEIAVLVLATGSPACERALIQRAWRESWPCRIVSTFIEAGDLGGHAIGMQPGEPGCFECLYTKDEDGHPMLRGALLMAGQDVVQEINGCGAFTPYSAIAATRTALLAVELVLGDEQGYHRWAGAGNQAQHFGLQPSSAWESLRSGHLPTFLSKEQYQRADCPCCSA
jgi:molybdopterin/thiamine biosynthesis adenylyltransferase